MIMMANMKIAAIVDTAFSTAPSALNNPLSTLKSPQASCRCPHPTDLFDRHGRDHCVELPKRVASVLATGIKALGPGLGNALQKVLELLGRRRLKAHPRGGQGILGRLIGLLYGLAGGGNDLVRDIDHRLLDLGRKLLPGRVADGIGHDEASETYAVGRIFHQ